MNPAPTSAMETNIVALIRTPVTPMASAGGAAGAATSLASPPSSVGPQTTLSDKAARGQIEAYVHTSVWLLLHAMEPRVGDPGVPACALQLAQPGHSIWACFFRRVRRKGTSVFKCTACGHESDRLHRAVSHQRAKWGHKPFPCTDLGW